jgi:hypothetical protein
MNHSEIGVAVHYLSHYLLSVPQHFHWHPQRLHYGGDAHPTLLVYHAYPENSHP